MATIKPRKRVEDILKNLIKIEFIDMSLISHNIT